MRSSSLFALLALLTACGGPMAYAPAPTAPLPSATLAQPAAPRHTSTPAPSPAPTATPQPTPTLAPTAVPAAPIDAPFDLAAQAAALRPEQAADMDMAAAWNRYTISGTLDVDARQLRAEQRVDYTNRDSAPLDAIYFHLYPNLGDFGGSTQVASLSVDGHAVEPALEAKGFLLRVNLPQPLAPGASASLRLGFTTSAPLGASRSKYGAFNSEAGVLAMASAYPTLAVVRGGLWDTERPDPKGDFVNSETALYDVSLRAPADWKLVTTGAAVGYEVREGVQTSRFVSGPQRDFTLAALQLQEASTQVDGTTITSYFRPGSAQQGQKALDAAARALAIYNRRFGPYPQRELEIIEISATIFFGVEYPGLTMINHTLYSSNTGELEITVAHEVAHMWFYNAVGNNVLRESWLDEAMASYAQVIYREETAGPAAAERELASFRERYRSNRAAGRDAPVGQGNSAFGKNYFAVVYGKGTLFIQALRNELGEQAFDRFLHSYYQQRRYQYVGGGDLLASAEEACGCQLDTLYTNWIERAVAVKLP